MASPAQCVRSALWGGTEITPLSKARFVPKFVLEKEAMADIPVLPLLPSRVLLAAAVALGEVRRALLQPPTRGCPRQLA